KKEQPGRNHVQQGQTVTYLSQPPTSGDHYQTPAPTGIYDSPIPNEVQVHNLEHGHIVFQYQPGQISDAILNGLKEIVRKHPTDTILAPRPDSPTTKMPFKLA